jgi:hypothetical protein
LNQSLSSEAVCSPILNQSLSSEAVCSWILNQSISSEAVCSPVLNRLLRKKKSTIRNEDFYGFKTDVKFENKTEYK